MRLSKLIDNFEELEGANEPVCSEVVCMGRKQIDITSESPPSGLRMRVVEEW